MTPALNRTHDPKLRSWVTSANLPDCDFPIQNLPFGVFRRRGTTETARIGVAIGDRILDLSACHDMGLLTDLPQSLQSACTASTLNPLMALGRKAVSALRHQLSSLLRRDAATSPPEATILVDMAAADLLLPATIFDYTDFYASIFHATNIGKLFRPDNPLLPNYKHIPIAYHGRASSIVPSGTPINRPQGQQTSADAAIPVFGPTKLLDYEMEVGWLIGTGNTLGEAIEIQDAERHIFGLCLVNDWSARDIQAWEYRPLGPFLAKNFATTISPWVVTLDALAPFRCPAFVRPDTDPQPLSYLRSEENTRWGGIDLTVEVWLHSAQMRQAGMDPMQLSRGSFSQMYWTIAQMLTHHSSNGCNLRSGDLLASGTVSEQEEGTQGSMLEITQRGERAIALPTGEKREFLRDGDEVILKGYCRKEGYPRVGFGECRGTVA